MISALDFYFSVLILFKKGYTRLGKQVFQAWKSFFSLRPDISHHLYLYVQLPSGDISLNQGCGNSKILYLPRNNGHNGLVPRKSYLSKTLENSMKPVINSIVNSVDPDQLASCRSQLIRIHIVVLSTCEFVVYS